MLSVKMDYKSVIAAALLGAGAVWLAKKAITKGVKEVAEKVNPADPDNVINEWFEDTYSFMTGSENSPGADLYDWLHQVEPEHYPPYEVPPQDPKDKDPRPDVWRGDIEDNRDETEKTQSGAGGGF